MEDPPSLPVSKKRAPSGSTPSRPNKKAKPDEDDDAGTGAGAGTGGHDKMQLLNLREWVLKRPETFLGEMAPVAALRWVVGWQADLATLSLEQPVTTLAPRALASKRAKQIAARAVEEVPATETKATEEPESKGTDDAVGVAARQPAAAYVLLEVSPAAEKIVDEVLQNMADRPFKDAKMKEIAVWVDDASGTIRARNDGLGMDVSMPDRTLHPEAPPDTWWPTIVFTRQFAGGNFEDSSGGGGLQGKHYQGGRNGVGAKATNICSRWFKVTVGDVVNKLWFQQEWRDHMGTTTGPTVKPYALKTGFVEVEFEPDLALFCGGGNGAAAAPAPAPAPGFPAGFAALVRGRVWELAAVTPPRVRVLLDGVRLPMTKLTDLVGCFPTLTAPGAVRAGARSVVTVDGVVVWEVVVVPASAQLPAGVLAFVNGVRCCAGAHVTHLHNVLADILQPAVRTRARDSKLELARGDVARHTFVVLSVRLDGPRFSSQAKDVLSTPCSEWGFAWEPEPAFCSRAIAGCASAIALTVATAAEAARQRAANAGLCAEASVVGVGGGRRAVTIPKYEPAAEAGKPGTAAILLLAEGDSAKTIIMAGRANRGLAALIGAYCLKGKPPNVRNAAQGGTDAVVLNNIALILGLEYGRVYHTAADTARLNYRHLYVLADQDDDGGHIAGLVVNWVETHWPSLLLVRPDFIKRFATPIVIATRAPGVSAAAAPQAVVRFLSQAALRAWLAATPAFATQYRLRYYKGLGTHTAENAREYFAHIEDYTVALRYRGAADHEALLDFFDAKRADVRKRMLGDAYDCDAVVDYTASEVDIATYLRCETLHYSKAHGQRNLTGIDGLKRTNRKVLFGVQRHCRPGGEPKKLTELGMSAAKDTHYHHGEDSLYGTMVNLAQAHVGTNNVNLLQCACNMGSRMSPRKIFPAPRYLVTGTDAILSALFIAADLPVLQRAVEDGDVVEPEVMAPVVPVDLLNGCSGVGTGWASEIPAFHPLDVIRAFVARVAGDTDWVATANGLRPWYDGFTGGVVVAADGTSWTTVALYHLEAGARPGVTNVVVSDLPIGTWTDVWEEKVLPAVMLDAASAKAAKEAAGAAAKEAAGAAAKEAAGVAAVSAGAGAEGGAGAASPSSTVSGKTAKPPKKKKAKADGSGSGSGGAHPRFVLYKGSSATDTRVRLTLECDTAALEALCGEARLPPLQPDPRAHFNTADQSVLDQAAEVYGRQCERRPALEAALHLTSTTTLKQLYRFSAQGRIVHHPNIASIVDEYYAYRMAVLAARLQHQAAELARHILVLDNRIRFAAEFQQGVFDLRAYTGDSERQWWAVLAARGYVADSDPRVQPPPLRVAGGDAGAMVAAAAAPAPVPVPDPDPTPADGVEDDGGDDGDAGGGGATFRYLTGTPAVRLTPALVRTLTRQRERLQAQLDSLAKDTPAAVWLAELEALAHAYRDFAARRAAANHVDESADAGVVTTKAKAPKRRAGQPRGK